METNRETSGPRRPSFHEDRDDEFATHYYGNERDLRKRDRAARENRERRNERVQAKLSSDRAFEQARVKRARDSRIGREPYEPEREYHRAYEDSQYPSSSDRRNWKQLYNDFTDDFSNLFRKESQLIRTELGEKAELIKQGAYSITTGTIVAFVGVQCLAATAVIALGQVMQWWLAALVVGVGLLLVGWIMMSIAKRKLSGDSLTPYRSIESFDHMGHMLKEKKDEFTRH